MSDGFSLIEVATFLVALAAALTSIVSVIEMQRQRENDVRPVLVVLEKLVHNTVPGDKGIPRFNTEEEGGYALYLVNMGQAVAIGLKVSVEPGSLEFPGTADSKHEKPLQTEIAVGRRALIATGYKKPVVDELNLIANYTDVNKKAYVTRFHGPDSMRHEFGKSRGETTKNWTERIKKSRYFGEAEADDAVSLDYPESVSDRADVTRASRTA